MRENPDTVSSPSTKKTTKKHLMVFSGRAHPALADEVARDLGIELVPTQAYEFANSEIYVRYEESVRGCDAFVIQSHTAPINEWIMEHLIMVDALKRASAKRITVVMPFYGYARQDKKHRGREPISARLMADLFKTAGADRLITVDLHADQIQGFFDGPVDHLMALPILADVRQGEVRRPGARRGQPGRRPDQGRRALVVAARRGARWRSSTRPGAPTGPTRPSPTASSATSRGRICVLVDDMIDTGGTIVHAAEALARRRRGGRRDRRHPPDPVRRGGRPAQEQRRSTEIVVTDTLPISDEKRFDKLTCLSIAPLLSQAIKEVFEDGSVTKMFDGEA